MEDDRFFAPLFVSMETDPRNACFFKAAKRVKDVTDNNQKTLSETAECWV
jgi:hypothetical protein